MKQRNEDEAMWVWKDLMEYWDNMAGTAIFTGSYAGLP
jgi:hypothetical protein